MIKRGLVLATIVVAALAYAGVAAAAAPDGLGPWADYVVAHNQGCAYNPPDMTTCVPPPAARSDPTAALGVAESPAGPNSNPPPGSFYSLGFSGDPVRGTAFITLGFDNPICNVPGADLGIQLFEITQEPYPNETVQVYVSADNVNYVFAGTVTKDGVVAMPASVPVANFVKLVEVSNKFDFIASPIIADGYDLDGVKSLSTATCGGTGFLEICKSYANGMTGRSFDFSAQGGSAITVRGGRCSGPFVVSAGAVRITEGQSSPATDVQSIQVRSSNRLIYQDLSSRTVVVRVVPSTSSGSETQVTFVNEPAGGLYGSLKICKLSESPAYWGVPFSFSVNGGPIASTVANPAFDDPSTWSCRIYGTFLVGSKVSVKETIPAGGEVSWFDTDPPAALLDFDTVQGTALVQISSPVTTLLVDNEPVAPSQSGWIEVCKDRATVNGAPDAFVTGTFQFTVVDADGTSYTVSTTAGQCTQAFQVAAGIVSVTEAPSPNQTLVDTNTYPADRWVDENLINRTVDVEVPVSSSMNDETQVHFVNQHDRGQVKLCKQLGPNSSALQGDYTFTVTSAGMPTATPTVTAGQCTVVGNYPVGATVTVKENLDHTTPPGSFIDTTGEGDYVVGSGVNTINVTNTGYGLLDICKKAVPGINVQPTFHFKIDNVTLVNVRAGTCDSRRITPGQHTVSEIAEMYYELDPYAPGGGIVVSSNGSPSSVSTTTRSATFTVPFADDVSVTFTNRIKRGQVKVCKSVPQTSYDAFDGKTFTFTLYIQSGGSHAMATYNSYPLSITFDKTNPLNACTLETPANGAPVLQANGEKTIVGVQESIPPKTAIDSISVSQSNGACVAGPGTPGGNDSPNCVGTTGIDTTQGIIDFFLAPTNPGGTSVVTYTQHATP